jgi:hypothetical protein
MVFSLEWHAITRQLVPRSLRYGGAHRTERRVYLGSWRHVARRRPRLHQDLPRRRRVPQDPAVSFGPHDLLGDLDWLEIARALALLAV